MDGIICSIINHKGGVGKTSTACNLGAALALKKQRVLVVDNDPQANTTSILLKDTPIKNTLYELLNNPQKPDIQDCVYHSSAHTGLYCLPNVEETSGLELDLVAKFPDSNFYLRNRVRDYAKKNFDIVLIDCPPSLSVFTSNALHASDLAIIPITAGSGFSLDGLKKVLNLIDIISSNGNPDLNFLRLLVNRIDKRTVVSLGIITEVQDRFNENEYFKTTIPTDAKFERAEFMKKTVFSLAPSSRGARAYRKLAEEILEILSNRD
jgi:chromosome partitioning protein